MKEVIFIKQYKTIVIPIKTNKDNIDYLFKCNRESARVWNKCLELDRNLWKNEQKHVDRKYLQDNIKGNFSDIIPAKAMQITIKKYLQAIKGIRQAIKQGRNDEQYPWRFKKNYNTIWDYAMFKIDYDKKIIKLCRPKCQRKIINGKYRLNPIVLKFKTKLPHNIIYIELLYDNGLKLALNYKDETTYVQIKSNNISAIDLGEIHSITSIDNKGNSFIITGRQIRSYQRFRNKELSKLHKKLSKCKKGSRNYKKYRKAIKKLMSKSNKKINNDIHKTSNLYVKYVINNNIKNVIIGDLTKFNMNLKNSKRNKQKLAQWQHGKLINKLKEKLNKYDVKIEKISEAYTSQTCPNCGNKHKPTSRNYVCNICGFSMHRDLVGANNILSKYINDGKIKKTNLKIKPIKYLRIDC